MKRLISIVFFLAAVPVLGDLNIAENNMQENYTETVKASGKFYLGVQYSGQHDFDNLYVDLPENSNGTLCISLSSIDGLYKAKLQYLITDEISGRTKVNFESKYERRLSSLGVNELALRATLGDDCDSQDAKTLMSSWTADTTKAVPVLIIRSGVRIDVAHIPNISESKMAFICKKFDGPDTVTFDKYCELDAALLESLASVEVYRRNMKALSPEAITISR